MSIDFSTLQGLTIPEGVVTKITDASGRVLWELKSAKIVLEVSKITSDTYAGETTYSGEEFILLNIYPKTSSSTINVTYGGLTKTLTFSGTNAQQVFFGTFNGTSDSTATPASGTLTIEGDCVGFGVGSYTVRGQYKNETYYCGCITSVIKWGKTTSIPSHAFYQCHNLINVNIPNGVTTIGDSAFYDCENLSSVSIPSSIASIGTYGFGYCNNITNVYIEDINAWCRISFGKYESSVTNYMPSPVSSNTNVYLNNVLVTGASITIPSGVTNIDYTFSGWNGIKTVNIPSSVTSIGVRAFTGCSNLSTVNIPNSVTTIGDYAFYQCAALTTINIPNSVTTIGDYAFYNSVLSLNKLPEGVTSIGECSFATYDVFRNVDFTLPSTITTIGSNAFIDAYCGDGQVYFDSCLKGRKLIMLATTPPTLEDSSFLGGQNPPTIVVPTGCGEAYKSAVYWSVFSEKIVEAS